MMRYRDIRQLQQILLMQKLIASLLILRYIQMAKAISENQSGNMIGEYDEQGQVNIDYIYLGSTPIARVDEWWENMPIPKTPIGANLIPGDKQLTVTWNANAEPVDGYKVYWGTESGKYTSSANVGKVNSHAISGLTNGISYYIAVKAYADIKATYFYHTDHLGTPILMTNNSGTIVFDGDLLPFGERDLVKGSVTNNLGLPGQYSDVETGLYYNWWRYFNDKLGRYDSFDPILHPANGPPAKAASCGNSAFGSTFDSLLFTPAKLNPFIYVGNNPINLTDPTGLASCGSGWKQIFVPDRWFGWYSFSGPCSTHDNCYGCDGAKTNKSQSDCDSEFLRNMLGVCSKLEQNSYWKDHCEGTASIYYDYVVKNGKPYFDAARKKCCKN